MAIRSSVYLSPIRYGVLIAAGCPDETALFTNRQVFWFLLGVPQNRSNVCVIRFGPARSSKVT